MMEKIVSLERCEELLKQNKTRFGKIRTNSFSPKKTLGEYCAYERLYAEMYPAGLCFYLDEGTYYRTYYFWSSEPIRIEPLDKPVLWEEPDADGRRSQEIEEICKDLTACGFVFHKNSSQYLKDLGGTSPEENRKEIDGILQKEGLQLVYCHDVSLTGQIFALWDGALDRMDISWKKRDFLHNSDDRVACICDAQGRVVSVYWWNLSGRRSEGHHLVTHRDYLRRHLATVLYREWENSAMEAGIGSLISWIDDLNRPSIDLHEKIGFRKTGKTSVQYLLG